MTDHTYESARQVPAAPDLEGCAKFTAWAADYGVGVNWFPAIVTGDDWVELVTPDGSTLEALPGQWAVRTWRQPTEQPEHHTDVEWAVVAAMLSDHQAGRLAAFRRSITNHTPTPAAIEAIHAVRSNAMALAEAIVSPVDPEADLDVMRAQELALTRIEEAVNWGVKAIVLACGEPTDGVPAP